MRRTVCSVLSVLAIVIIIATVACASPLVDLLAMVPQELSNLVISFTDWSQIKANLGLGFLTSDGPELFRLELGRRVSQDQAAASAYALPYLRTHAEMWGWDTADLAWAFIGITQHALLASTRSRSLLFSCRWL